MPLRVAKTRYLRLGEVARGEHGLDALALAQRQHVDERAALGGARGLGQLVDLRAVDLAAVGEEQQVVVRRARRTGARCSRRPSCPSRSRRRRRGCCWR